MKHYWNNFLVAFLFVFTIMYSIIGVAIFYVLQGGGEVTLYEPNSLIAGVEFVMSLVVCYLSAYALIRLIIKGGFYVN